MRRLRQFGVRPNRELGQNFLIDDNTLRIIGEAAELGADDVVLEVGGGLGVLSEHLAAQVGLRARDRGRPLAARAARGRAGPVRERRPPLRRRRRARLRDARAGSRQDRREPALRRRRDGAAEVDRRAAGRDAVGGDGPARGRGPAGRGTGAAHLRRDLRAGAAGLRGALPAQGPAHRLPPRAERRLRAADDAPARPGAAAAADRARPRRLRPPPQGAAPVRSRSCPALRTTSAPPPATGWSASASRPTPARSGWHPRTGHGSPTRSGTSGSRPCARDDRDATSPPAGRRADVERTR